jgi:tRNA(adenine34) deaminase
MILGSGREPLSRTICFRAALFCLLLAFPLFARPAEDRDPAAAELDSVEKAVFSFAPDPHYPHDPFILVTLKEAITAKREKSGGGVGACLVRESTGEIVARGRNRQYAPYFRSDMHAKMDLISQYEDRMRVVRSRDTRSYNPRRMDGLVLYSSVEPCPMCLARIINSGLKKAFYVAPDSQGGMVHRINDLPPFWRDGALGRTYAEASCSPALKELASRLFQLGQRNATMSN